MTRRKRWLTAVAGLLGLALDVTGLVVKGLVHAILVKRVPCTRCRRLTVPEHILEGGLCLTCSMAGPETQRRPGWWHGGVFVTPPASPKPKPGPLCALCEAGHPVGNARKPMTSGACPVCGDPAGAAPPSTEQPS